MDPLVSKAGYGVAKWGITKLLASSALDRLIAGVSEHPNAPALNRKLAVRLTRLIPTEAALDALFDQDERGEEALSTLLAQHVFQEPPSAASKALAQAMITEFPGALETRQAFNLVAYSLRQLKATSTDQFQQLLRALTSSDAADSAVAADSLSSEAQASRHFVSALNYALDLAGLQHRADTWKKFTEEAGRQDVPTQYRTIAYRTFTRYLSGQSVRCLDWDFCHPLITIVLREADKADSIAQRLRLRVGTLDEWKTFHGHASLHRKTRPPCGYREDPVRPPVPQDVKQQRLMKEQERARILSGEGVIETVKAIYPNYELVHLWDVDYPICTFEASSTEHRDLEAALAVTPPEGARLPGRRELPLETFYPGAHDRLEELNLRFDEASAAQRRSFFPGSTFTFQRLWFTDTGSPRLDCTLGRYFASIATSEDLDPEMMKALTANPDLPVRLSELNQRRWLHGADGQPGSARDPVVDGFTRAAAISHATVVVVAQDEGSYDLWLPIRSDDVETHPFFNHVAPSGIFSPHEERDYPSASECSVERNFFREWAEELYAQDAHERPPWLNAPDPEAAPEVIRLREALDDPRVAELIYTGVSVNLLTLRPEICLALIIHDPAWLDDEMQVAEDFGRPMQLGWEYAPRDSVRTLSRDQSDSDFRIRIDAPLFQPTNKQKYDRAFLVPNAAAAIRLATNVLTSRHAKLAG